jgi:hypothetical protein
MRMVRRTPHILMNDVERVIDSEERLAAAHLSLDLAEIEALLHDDYVIVQPGGALETRSDVLASYRSGARAWSKADVDQLDVRIYGECARVVGRWTAAGVNNGAAFDYQARFVSIWVRQHNTWWNLSYASAEIAG